MFPIAGAHYFIDGYVTSKSRYDINTNSLSTNKLVRELGFLDESIATDGIARFTTSIYQNVKKKEKLPKLQGLSGSPLLQVMPELNGGQRLFIAGICVNYSLSEDKQSYIIEAYSSQFLNFMFEKFNG